MWVLNIETTYENTILAAFARKNNVSFTGYPINYKTTKEGLRVQTCGFLEENNVSFLKRFNKLKKEKFVKNINIHKNFVIADLLFPTWLSVLYSPDILFLKPIEYTKDGTEKIEVASWTKKPLMDLYSTFKKRYNTQLISIVQKPVKTISLISVRPDLTDKQKIALRLAIHYGYYEFPKRITIKQLAKKMGISFSTYQAHLSKAESRFIPLMFDRFS